MLMDLVVLGSGSALPYARRSSASHAVFAGSECVLFDLGAGSLRRAAEAGIDVFGVGHAFFTHFHVDHVADLVPLLFAKHHPGLGRNRDLTLHGPPGLTDFVEWLRVPYGEWVEGRGFRLEVEEVDPRPGAEPIRVADLEVRALPLLHRPESVGYRVEGPEGKVIAYSGDTGYCRALVELARDSDLFLVECSLTDQAKERGGIEGHLSPRDVARAGTESRAKRLLVTHLYPQLDEIDLAGAIRAHGFEGALTVAEDLMRVSL